MDAVCEAAAAALPLGQAQLRAEALQWTGSTASIRTALGLPFHRSRSTSTTRRDGAPSGDCPVLASSAWSMTTLAGFT